MRITPMLTADELENKIIQLRHWYIPIDLNPSFHSDKIECVGKLNDILDRARRQDLQNANIKEILQCALTISYYFSMRLKLRSTYNHFSRWYSKRQFLKAETVFQKTMDKLLPERSEAITTIMLAFFTDIALWPQENFVIQILEKVANIPRQAISLFHTILTDVRVHCGLVNNSEDARHRIRVLYDLLKSEHLDLASHELISFIKRLLDYYTNSFISIGNSNLEANLYLKAGYQVCLRRIFERVANKHHVAIIITTLDWFSSLDMQDDDMLQFSALVQYEAEIYKVGSFSQCLPDGLMNRVLKAFVGSENPMHSLVGCRLIQHFVDREQNAKYLVEPKLYYEIAETQLRHGKYSDEDIEFLRKHRDKLQDYFIHAITKHCEYSTNLKAVFSVVCCMILELPCGKTAAAAAYMMMFMQNLALSDQNISHRCKHWMHAIVISVMSLICWVHKAPFLCKYVNQIMTRRAKDAPQLNPPLLREYDEKIKNPWNDTTLFFEEWELKYGLWKAFSIPPGKYSVKYST